LCSKPAESAIFLEKLRKLSIFLIAAATDRRASRVFEFPPADVTAHVVGGETDGCRCGCLRLGRGVCIGTVHCHGNVNHTRSGQPWRYGSLFLTRRAECWRRPDLPHARLASFRVRQRLISSPRLLIGLNILLSSRGGGYACAGARAPGFARGGWRRKSLAPTGKLSLVRKRSVRGPWTDGGG
jgi:hypothetical protein